MTNQPIDQMTNQPNDQMTARLPNHPTKRLNLLFILVCLISGCNSRGDDHGSKAAWRWQRAEAGLPRQAVMMTVAADPNDSETLWAGYYGPAGLATSRDGGQNWQEGLTGQTDNPVFDLLVEPGGGLWMATRIGLLYSAFDPSGETPAGEVGWTPGGHNLPPVTAFALAADDLGQIYVGLDDAGVYRKKSGEATWQPLSNDPALMSAAILALAVSGDGQYIYAGVSAGGLLTSRDGGQTWQTAFPGAYVANLALNPNDPNQAVASLHHSLVRTQNGGQSWQLRPRDWELELIGSLLWLPNNTLLAGTGQGRIYGSLDGGETWTNAGRILTEGGVLDLAPAGDQLLAATWTGIYRGQRREEKQSEWFDWTYLSPTLGVPNANTLLTTPAGLLLGTRTGLFIWQPEANAWQPRAETFPIEAVTALTMSPDGQILYAAASNGLQRSDDGGQSWTLVPSVSRIGAQALVLDPTNTQRLYKLAVWERVYKSEDGGQTWAAQWAGLDVATEGSSLALDPFDPLTLYMGAETGLYRSRQGESHWQPIAPTLTGQTILTVVARPAPEPAPQTTILYLGATRGLYRSLDGGKTVESWGEGLADISVTALLFHPDDPQQIYAGTAFEGLYQSTDGGRRWTPIGPPGLKTEVIQAMAWGPSRRLFAAALGGVWVGERGIIND